jgi:siroheme synthase
VWAEPELTGPLAHRLPERAASPSRPIPVPTPARLIEAASAGQLAVRLFAGDPLLFSRASQQADGCARAGVRVEIVPGVSAATGVPASPASR